MVVQGISNMHCNLA